jgi:transcriptional regulator with XRE-family HTH domain
LAFGQAVRAARLAQGIAQDEFAGLAGIARSHMGKIERGEHMPLALILKISLAQDQLGRTDDGHGAQPLPSGDA